MQTKSQVKTWEERVRALEAEGCTRSDAQAVIDAEDQRNKAKHTPGPWQVIEGLYGNDHELTVWGPNDSEGLSEFIAALDNQQGHDRGNARLIAAAPKLLAQLKEAQKFIACLLNTADDKEVHDALVNNGEVVEDGIKEVIAEAEGR